MTEVHQHNYSHPDTTDSDQLEGKLITEEKTESITVTDTASASTRSILWRILAFLLNFLLVNPNLLVRAEEKLYRGLKSIYFGHFVKLRSGDSIWTIKSLRTPKNSTPIVLLHDFGCASGIWIENIDFLSRQNPLYMIDILGFGRSSRPDFNNLTSNHVETKFIESIEDWRTAVKIDQKFILIGHGFGAYLAALYAVRYEKFVQKLILIDPWGFSAKPDHSELSSRQPFWINMITYFTKSWTSFSVFRFLGPLGLPILKFFVPRWKRLKTIHTLSTNSDVLYDYLYYVNAQPASGDIGFQELALWYGWAKDPIVKGNQCRIEQLSRDIPLTFIYGSRTHINITSTEFILQQRGSKNTSSKIIDDAGHFVFMENPIRFHELMSDLLYDVPRNVPSLASRDKRITTTVIAD